MSCYTKIIHVISVLRLTWPLRSDSLVGVVFFPFLRVQPWKTHRRRSSFHSDTQLFTRRCVEREKKEVWRRRKWTWSRVGVQRSVRRRTRTQTSAAEPLGWTLICLQAERRQQRPLSAPRHAALTPVFVSLFLCLFVCLCENFKLYKDKNIHIPSPIHKKQNKEEETHFRRLLDTIKNKNLHLFLLHLMLRLPQHFIWSTSIFLLYFISLLLSILLHIAFLLLGMLYSFIFVAYCIQYFVSCSLYICPYFYFIFSKYLSVCLSIYTSIHLKGEHLTF